MKQYIISFLIIFYFLPATVNSQSNKNSTLKALKVGNQLWMEENLDVAVFRNGNPIKQAKSMKEWKDAYDTYTPSWCYPEFKNSNSHLGKLYNVFAVNDDRGLAPLGWAIPTDYDWDLLVDFVGDEINGGKQLQSLPIVLNGSATNLIGSFFNKRPGSMNLDGFWGLGESNSWWSITSVNESNWVRYINKEGPIARHLSTTWGQGMAIRCIKSESSAEEAPKEYVENYDDNYTLIQSITIGSQNWSNKNLSVKHFRNGDTIQYVSNADEWKKANDAKIPAWCYYADRPINGKNYGLMYNWYAIVDKRGLAPLGWHIPSRNEWFKLFEHFGGDSLAGPELKNKVLWYGSGNDRSEMNILPAGGRNMYGVFHFGIGGSVAFWTSTEFNSEMAYCIYFGDKDKVTNSTTEKSHGYYLRCIKD
jgi:uncharacterized protein (TIGR02145 family)